jgi:hypothetical protein
MPVRGGLRRIVHSMDTVGMRSPCGIGQLEQIIESVFSRAARPRRCDGGKVSDPRRSTKNVLD